MTYPLASDRSNGGGSLAGHARRSLLIVAFATILAALAGQLITLRIVANQSARDRVFEWARIGANQLVDSDAGDFSPAQAPSDRWHRPDEKPAQAAFEQWSRAVLRGRGAYATAIVDEQAKILTQWPPTPSLQRFVRKPIRSLEGATNTMSGAGAESRFLTAICPIDRGPTHAPTVFTCVVALPQPPPMHHKALALFTAGVAAASLFAVATALALLRRRLFTPWRRLTGGISAGGAAAQVDRRLLSRADELGLLARGVHALCIQLEDARRRAEHVEESVGSLVQQQTRQIHAELDRTRRQAEIDPLTGLANRRFIEARLESLFNQLVARRRHLSLVMLDVDNFKPLNDTEGHSVGDSILRFIGELLRSTLRESDVGVRYGGDEFAVVLPDTTAAQARAIAERVIRLFAQRFSTMNIGVPVTLSAGVASAVECSANSASDLMAKADEALYASKRSGKNSVAVA